MARLAMQDPQIHLFLHETRFKTAVNSSVLSSGLVLGSILDMTDGFVQ